MKFAKFFRANFFTKICGGSPELCVKWKILDVSIVFPVNICWSSRRLEDVLKTCLQHVFNVTIFRLPRRLEDVLQIRLEDVLEDKKLLR